jgi:glutathione S-transferase
MQLKRSKEDVIAEINKIPDAEIRKIKSSIFELGIKAPEVLGALSTVQDLLQRMAVHLKEQKWLAGSMFSLAETAIFPYLLRLEHLGMDFLWQGEQFAPLRDWMGSVKNESAYQSAIVHFIPEPMLLMLKGGAKESVSYLKENL